MNASTTESKSSPASVPVARKVPAPLVSLESAAYWQAANEGRLLVKRCLACGDVHFYPRDICPFCLSDETEWLQAEGTGTIYSFSTMGKAEAAYTLAFVSLDEGVTVLTNLVNCDPSVIAIGQRVTVVFVPSDGGQAVPMFTPL